MTALTTGLACPTPQHPLKKDEKTEICVSCVPYVRWERTDEHPIQARREGQDDHSYYITLRTLQYLTPKLRLFENYKWQHNQIFPLICFIVFKSVYNDL